MSTNNADFRIAIIGAGIAGLACALAFERQGHAPVVLERGPGERGAGLFLTANGVRTLTELGLRSALLDRAFVVHHQKMHDEVGQLLSAADLRVAWGEEHPCVACARASLHEILRDALRSSEVMDGARVECVDEGPSAATVITADGSVLEADLVVAADGIHSAVRRTRFAGDVRYAGESYWRAIVPCPPDVDCWSGFWEGPRMIGLVPISGGEAYLFVGEYGLGPIGGVNPPMPARPVGEFPMLARHRPDVLEVVMNQTDLRCTHAEFVFVDVPVTDHVVLVGDAAHGCGPSLAQGAASALEDALHLARFVDSHDLGPSLRRYAESRHDKLQYIQRASTRRTQIAQLDGATREGRLRAFGKAAEQVVGPIRAIA